MSVIAYDLTMPREQTDYAAWVRGLRYHLDLSQVEFAALVGVSPATVYRWEAGTPPNGSHAKLLAALAKRRRYPSLTISTRNA